MDALSLMCVECPRRHHRAYDRDLGTGEATEAAPASQRAPDAMK